MTWFVAVQEGLAFGADPNPVSTQAVVTALVVVGLLAAGGWWLRHRLPMGRTPKLMAIETAMSLGDRRSLLVVEVESRRLLLGLTPHHIALLTELTPGAARDTRQSRSADGSTFQATLQASIEQGARP